MHTLYRHKFSIHVAYFLSCRVYWGASPWARRQVFTLCIPVLHFSWWNVNGMCMSQANALIRVLRQRRDTRNGYPSPIVQPVSPNSFKFPSSASLNVGRGWQRWYMTEFHLLLDVHLILLRHRYIKVVLEGGDGNTCPLWIFMFATHSMSTSVVTK